MSVNRYSTFLHIAPLIFKDNSKQMQRRRR